MKIKIGKKKTKNKNKIIMVIIKKNVNSQKQN